MPEVKGGGEQKNKNWINGGHNNSHNYFFFCLGEQIFRDSKINQKFPSSALGLDKKKI